jgi:GTP cyclohydrolase I
MKLTWADIEHEVEELSKRWADHDLSGVYGIPNGGTPIATMLSKVLNLRLLDEPLENCLVVDDLVDTGQTLSRYEGHRDVLYRKPWSPPELAPNAKLVEEWLYFPWEKDEGEPRDAVVRILSFLGDDPNREGLKDTPKRVLKAFKEFTSGYEKDPAVILSTVFTESYDEMVVLRNIEFVSLCEHHLQPFRGTAAVGYVPNGKVVGLSKLARLVDCYAQRLQVQERMTEQIANAVQEHLDPLGVAVYVQAHHSCMGNRGVRKHQASMVTQKLIGLMKEDSAARNEFMRLVMHE